MRILLAIAALLISACSHTIDFRASHFAVPVTGDEQWSGHVAGVLASNTRVTVINDVHSNPPDRSTLKVNEDVEWGDLFGLSRVGFDASLTVYKRFDLFLENGLLGVRAQVLNHGGGNDKWVASVQGAAGGKSITRGGTESGDTGTARSSIKSAHAGASIGYRFANAVPYLSYIRETHSVNTTVTNSNGSFGPYQDSGVHQFASIGIATLDKGFTTAFEYSRVDINWDRATSSTQQDAFGAKFGYAW